MNHSFFQCSPCVVHAKLLEKQNLHALIGRDVLERCLLNYNGTAGYFTLAW